MTRVLMKLMTNLVYIGSFNGLRYCLRYTFVWAFVELLIGLLGESSGFIKHYSPSLFFIPSEKMDPLWIQAESKRRLECNPHS